MFVRLCQQECTREQQVADGDSFLTSLKRILGSPADQTTLDMVYAGVLHLFHLELHARSRCASSCLKPSIKTCIYFLSFVNAEHRVHPSCGTSNFQCKYKLASACSKIRCLITQVRAWPALQDMHSQFRAQLRMLSCLRLLGVICNTAAD